MPSTSSSRGSNRSNPEPTLVVLQSRSHEPISQSGSQSGQQPIVIQQAGGNGTAIGLVVAALILAGGAIWAISIWSNTQIKMIQAPAEAIKEGAETIKQGVEGAAESIKPGS